MTAGPQGAVQATVRAYDAATRSGELVRDDGVVLRFDAEAVDPAVLGLRPGQRARARLADGVVDRLTLVGLPFT